MTKLYSYNIIGLNNSTKEADVHAFLVDNHISFVGLVETRVKCQNSKVVASKVFANWNWDFNYDFHYNGCIWIG